MNTMVTGKSSKAEISQVLEETEGLQNFYVGPSTFFLRKSIQEYEKLIGNVVSLAFDAPAKPFVNHVILEVFIYHSADTLNQVAVVFRTCDVATVQECFVVANQWQYCVHITLPERFDVENKVIKSYTDDNTYSKPLLSSYDMYYVSKERLLHTDHKL